MKKTKNIFESEKKGKERTEEDLNVVNKKQKKGAKEKKEVEKWRMRIKFKKEKSKCIKEYLWKSQVLFLPSFFFLFFIIPFLRKKETAKYSFLLK